MRSDANAADDPDDLAALRAYAGRLLAAVVEALPGWVERAVVDRYERWAGGPLPDAVRDEARQAGAQAVAAVEPPLRALLAADVDDQRANPLMIIRSAVRFPATVLHDAGVPPVERDAQARTLFPDDAYDLTPGSFADLHDSVREPGLVWGAAKAHVTLRRRR